MMSHPGSGFPWILLLRQYLELTMTNSATMILSDSGLASLRNLIAIRRALDPKFSYSYISKKIGIKSRSYLSEAMKGTKKLNEKHIGPIVDLLDLPEAEADLLKNKVLLETGDLSQAEIDRLKRLINDAEKKFSSGQVVLTDVRDLNLALILAVCLYLFKDGQATKREIIELFGRDRYYDIERGLSDLIRNGLLVREDEVYRYADNFQDILHMYTSLSKRHESDYLKSAIQEAHHAVDQHMDQRASSIFYSGIITAEQLAYLQSMDYIKQNLRNIQSRIESKEADTLIRFNVQIYPILSRN